MAAIAMEVSPRAVQRRRQPRRRLGRGHPDDHLRRSEKVREGQRRLEEVGEGQRRAEKIREGQRRFEEVREGQRRAEKGREGRWHSDGHLAWWLHLPPWESGAVGGGNVREGQRRSEKVREGQRRSEKGTEGEGGRWRATEGEGGRRQGTADIRGREHTLDSVGEPRGIGWGEHTPWTPDQRRGGHVPRRCASQRTLPRVCSSCCLRS